MRGLGDRTESGTSGGRGQREDMSNFGFQRLFLAVG